MGMASQDEADRDSAFVTDDLDGAQSWQIKLSYVQELKEDPAEKGHLNKHPRLTAPTRSSHA